MEKDGQEKNYMKDKKNESSKIEEGKVFFDTNILIYSIDEREEIATRVEKAIRLFEKHGVFTQTELTSRAEILYETYAKTINIEALTMIDMAKKQIVPATIKYQTSLADSINAIDWNLKARNQRLCDYYAGLIALRKAHPAFRLVFGRIPEEEQEFVAAQAAAKADVPGPWKTGAGNLYC